MDPIVSSLLELLSAYGPWLLFLLAILETCFVTGLVVPSGVATSVATVLALDGRLELIPVVVAAGAGGAIGDSIGFWIGRWSGERVLSGDGVWARRAAAKREALDMLYGRHPVYSVTVARLISFVRTLMPMVAGMSGLAYRRYLPYELVGVLGWVLIYVLLGIFARESWEVATRLLGAAGAVAFAVAGLVLWIGARRSARAGPAEASPE